LITSRLLPPFHRDCICEGFLYCSLFNESEYWSKLVEVARPARLENPKIVGTEPKGSYSYSFALRLEERCTDGGSLELGNPADPKLLAFKVQ
jgi:hypothetical protein